MITTGLIAIALWEGGKWLIKKKLLKRGGNGDQ